MEGLIQEFDPTGFVPEEDVADIFIPDRSSEGNIFRTLAIWQTAAIDGPDPVQDLFPFNDVLNPSHPESDQINWSQAWVIHRAYQAYLSLNPDPFTGAGFGVDPLTSHGNAHAISRHGEGVETGQLLDRAMTGRLPDTGKIAKTIPDLSTASNSNITLRYTDRFIRESGILATAVSVQDPSKNFVFINPEDVGIIGDNIGRGFERIAGNHSNVPDIVTDLNSAGGLYVMNPSNGLWETITLHPAKVK